MPLSDEVRRKIRWDDRARLYGVERLANRSRLSSGVSAAE
jgi:hypothetical protein